MPGGGDVHLHVADGVHRHAPLRGRAGRRSLGPGPLRLDDLGEHAERDLLRSGGTDVDPGRTVKSLYLLILARPPDAGEIEVATAYYKTPGINPKQATDDVAWALINSKEFLFRH